MNRREGHFLVTIGNLKDTLVDFRMITGLYSLFSTSISTIGVT